MIKIKTFLAVVGLTSVLAGCFKDNENLFDSTSAVLSGYLYSGNVIDSILISQSNSYRGDGIYRTIDDLEVIVSDGDNDYLLNFIGNGYYQSKEMKVLPGRDYTINFAWQGVNVSASTHIPEPNGAEISDTIIYREQVTGSGGFRPGSFERPDPIEVSWNNPDGDYYFVQVENIEDNAEYIFTFFQELIAQGDTIGRPSFRTRPEIIDFYAIDSFNDLQQYGKHRVVVYRLNSEYAALYEQLGNSSISISSPPTNVVNGLGIFTGISTDTLFFEIRKE